jgi:hypothetical protein
LPFNGDVQIVPMTAAYAAEVVTWRYPVPYDCFRASTDGRGYEMLIKPEPAP